MQRQCGLSSPMTPGDVVSNRSSNLAHFECVMRTNACSERRASSKRNRKWLSEVCSWVVFMWLSSSVELTKCIDLLKCLQHDYEGFLDLEWPFSVTWFEKKRAQSSSRSCAIQLSSTIFVDISLVLFFPFNEIQWEHEDVDSNRGHLRINT